MPPSPYDRTHNCIVAAGNGLCGEIWEPFRKRFGVPELREFYRSTEGVAKFDNHGVGAWGVGKVGFSGPICRFLEDDTFIVRYDPDTEMPYRDPRLDFVSGSVLVRKVRRSVVYVIVPCSRSIFIMKRPPRQSFCAMLFKREIFFSAREIWWCRMSLGGLSSRIGLVIRSAGRARMSWLAKFVIISVGFVGPMMRLCMVSSLAGNFFLSLSLVSSQAV